MHRPLAAQCWAFPIQNTDSAGRLHLPQHKDLACPTNTPGPCPSMPGTGVGRQDPGVGGEYLCGAAWAVGGPRRRWLGFSRGSRALGAGLRSTCSWLGIWVREVQVQGEWNVRGGAPGVRVMG